MQNTLAAARHARFKKVFFLDSDRPKVGVGIVVRNENKILMQKKINEPDRTESIGWFDAGQLPEPLFLPLKNLAEGKSYPQVDLCQ